MADGMELLFREAFGGEYISASRARAEAAHNFSCSQSMAASGGLQSVEQTG